MEVQVLGNNVERAIKDLKRQLQKGGLFREIKEKRFYEKPSVKKKRKRKEAQRKKMKAVRRRRGEGAPTQKFGRPEAKKE
ncbi:MAG: 30S ribosomal protein S21 [bacterium]